MADETAAEIPVLDDWLTSVGAVLLWRVPVPVKGFASMYVVGQDHRTVLVHRFQGGGWAVYLEACGSSFSQEGAEEGLAALNSQLLS